MLSVTVDDCGDEFAVLMADAIDSSSYDAAHQITLYEGADRDGCPAQYAEMEANACLITAAPEMYEALKAVEAHHAAINAKAGRDESRSKTLGIVRAAIAKAEQP